MTLVRIAVFFCATALAAPLAAQTPAATPTFADDVAPIVFAKCATCHRPGEATPFSLLTYDDVRRRGRTIADVTSDRYMPPWHAETEMAEFRDDRRLTDDELRTIRAWVAGGMPQGDAARTPKPPQFTAGWQLGEPDLVVRMTEAMQVPEDGPDLFRNFAIPLNLDQDRWISAIEFRPSGKASHHALFFFDATGNALAQDASDAGPGFRNMNFIGGGGAGRGGRGGGGLRALLSEATGAADAPVGALGGWAVGGSPSPLPDGIARRLPAGSALVLQMHFHPNGKPETEQATIGIHFADGPPARTLAALQLPPLFGAIAGIDIPAGEQRYVIRDSFTLPIDMDVLGGGGHAHYLATDMKLTVTEPGGAARELFSIPRWDFNWQERYYFEKPIRLPAGTRVDVEIAYDNTAANPANPFDPPQRVTFGRESTDEMGSITLEMLAVREDELPQHAAAVQQHVRTVVLGRLGGGGARRGDALVQ